MIQAHSWNWGNSIDDAKGRSQVKKSEAARTEACIEDGLIRSSAEAAVMVAEQRDQIKPAKQTINSEKRMSS